MLLILDDEDGRFARVPDRQLRYALAGGVLMDLALENRIDTDLKQLMLVDPAPLGDSLLDATLADIAAAEETHDARFWVERTALRSAEAIREAALDRLVERGILQRQEDRFLWVFRSRRYPVIDDRVEREVKLRIMEILFSDQIPTPRDVVIIGLAHACNLFEQILSAREVEHIAPRIDEVRRLDLISQAMAQAISDIEVSLALAMHMPPYS
ncbi:MAG: GPP34 family phosphoprotein [Acidobacteria bacterium]|nr:GPP34 family phosphoprotein [Acidobacteriota bacterium]